MKLIFATAANNATNELLNDLGIEDRLVSYFYVESSGPAFIETYVREGTYRNPKSRTISTKRKPPNVPAAQQAPSTHPRRRSLLEP